MWEGESHREGKLVCVDGEKIDFYLKNTGGGRVVGGRGQELFCGENQGYVELGGI